MVDQDGQASHRRPPSPCSARAPAREPGHVHPIALKAISETDPTAAGYVVQWLFFALVSLLPLLTAIVLLVVAPGRAKGAASARARVARTPC